MKENNAANGGAMFIGNSQVIVREFDTTNLEVSNNRAVYGGAFVS